MSQSVLADEGVTSALREPEADSVAVKDAVTATRRSGSPESGGSRELLTLALPLVVSQGFMTVQVFVDTILLSWHDPREMAASFPAVMWFWLIFGLLQVTAGYVSTFVAQYTGAGRPERVVP
jgi:MATE family multidrug resistance protein